MFSGSYAWSNFTVLALGVWAVAQRDSIDAIGMVSGERGRREGRDLASSMCPSSVPGFSSSYPTFFCSKALYLSPPGWRAPHQIGWRLQNPKTGYPPRQSDLLRGCLLGERM